MNPTESNLDTNSKNTETTQVNSIVTPPPVLEVPEVAKEPSISSNTAPSGLTSFPPNESTPPINASNSSASSEPKARVIDAISKKEVVSRPLLWGVVTFLFFAGLVIGGVSLFRLYSEQDITTDVSESLVPAVNSEIEVTTPANVIDNTPENANPTIQADAIDAEIQAIDTDIEEDALSDTQLGL